jgi:hypothetical protein
LSGARAGPRQLRAQCVQETACALLALGRRIVAV